MNQIFAKKSHYFLALVIFINATTLFSQVNISGSSAEDGSYISLGSAFSAINSGIQGASNNIIIDIVGNTNEAVTAQLNMGLWASLTIEPKGNVTRTITGNISGPLIDLNGAKNVTINGLNAAGNALVISNTETVTGTGSTIQFINNASNNTVTNCTILGSSDLATMGTIYFATASVGGNSNNMISNNLIGPAGNHYPRIAIYASGTSTAKNTNNTIINNSIADFFNPSNISNGIYIGMNNTGWTIEANKLYQTGTRVYTTASTHKAIQITSGDGYFIRNNVIGYSSQNGSGVYTMNSTIATRFVGIEVSTGTLTPSTIESNTITSIFLTTSSGAATNNGVLCSINITSGSHTVSNNLIGSTTGINSLQIQSTTAQAMNVGINCATSGSVTLSNNIMGGLSSSGITGAIAGNICGINVPITSAKLNIVDNIIGNSSTDNMRGGTNGLTTGSSVVSGIYLPLSGSKGEFIINGNTIQNLVSYGTNNNGYVRGIWTSGSTGSLSTFTVTHNTISNLSSNSSHASVANGVAAAIGINLGMGLNSLIANNSVSNIALTNTANAGNFAVGITSANATSTKILNNKIYNITNAGTSSATITPNIAAGIIIRSGEIDVTVANNFISLGNGQSTNTSFIGIMGNHASTPDPIDKIYFNTINIEGTVATGAQPSFGFLRGDLSVTARTANIDFKNNIITNTRSGGTGSHFAIANNYGNLGSITGWGINASNNNILNSNTLTVGYWAGSSQTFTNWKTNSSSDVASYSDITVTYVNSANDLHLNMGLTPTFIESRGQTIAGYNIDIDAQNRPGPVGSLNGGGVMPDIGADEIDAVFIDTDSPVINYTTLTNNCYSDFKKLTVTITDLSGVPTTGSLTPRMYFNKNNGTFVSTTGTLTSGTSKNGTWDYIVSNSLLGGVTNGDIISYYVIAQDISSPNPYIGSNPSVGLIATDVNNITTPPTITTETFVVNLMPNLNVSGGVICQGQSYTIEPSGANTYSISGGLFTVTPNASTIYTISATATNNCTNTALVTITVNATPTITVNGGAICSGQSFTIEASGADSYTYSSVNNIVAPTSNTDYTVTGVSVEGCMSDEAISSVTVNATPAISVNSGVICSGQSFTIEAIGANTYSYSSGNSIVMPTINTDYTITGVSVEGCTSSEAISSVTVNATPTISVNSGAICSGQSFTIEASGADSYTYSSVNNIVAPTSNADYTVTGVSVEGCMSDEVVSSVTVNAIPTISVNSGAICSGQSFTIEASGADSYTYSSVNNIVTPTSNTDYTVTGVSAEGCMSDEVVSSVTVNVTPIVTLTASQNTVCSGSSMITLDGLPSGGLYSGTNVTGNQFDPSIVDTYTVNYSYTDGNSCSANADVVILVDICTGIMSLNKTTNFEVSVYPNPFTNTIALHLNNVNETATLDLYDALHNLILNKKTITSDEIINLEGIDNGVYFIKINTATNTNIIKVVKAN